MDVHGPLAVPLAVDVTRDRLGADREDEIRGRMWRRRDVKGSKTYVVSRG